MDGFQYTSDTGDILLQSGLKFFPTTEGYYDFKNNKYIYSYVDHLGNIRVSYTREGANAVIIEKNDYYAFGLKHENSSDTSGVNYNYEYNGKEFQSEIGMNDYGARFYMPDLGRWGVIDPLAESFRRYSPYNYAVNNPMRFIDPDGRSAMDVITKLGGTWQNVGFGYFNAELGKYVDYEGNILNLAQVLEIRSFLDPNGSGGSIGGGTSDSSLSPWMQANIGSNFNFSQFDFTQFGAENIDCPKCPNQIHKEGEQVLEPKETFLGKLWATLEPRTWSDGGITYNVGADGKIVGIAPLTGTVPFGPGSSFNILKSFKSALSLSKGGLTNVGRAIQKHPNILRLIGKETSSITTNAARNQSGVEALKYIIRNGVREVKSHKTFGTVVEYKFPNGLGARFNAETNEFIGFLGRGL